MADLAALDALYEWMRPRGVLHARYGELELHLGPPLPVAASVEAAAPPEDPERDSIDALFWSSGADPTPFYPRRSQ